MTAPVECCPYLLRSPHDDHLRRLEAAIMAALARAAARLTRAVCGHLGLVRGVFEAPVRALVDGVAIECPECAPAAWLLGRRLVDAAVADVARHCGP
jgi:hypothetical protein